MIPEINGTSRNQIQKFFNTSTYAMSEINPAEEKSLLKVILCTKLTGKAIHDFQTRDIWFFAQLKQEMEMCYLAKQSTTHIQREFIMLQQKHGENAREYGLRVHKLAMELYQSMVEWQRTNERAKKGNLRYNSGTSVRKLSIGTSWWDTNHSAISSSGDYTKRHRGGETEGTFLTDKLP